ncbi:hypothetical protein, partial [Serratia marcescens]|uniref:hypothetical protein n=1 Tax=Serratia marcescens TaxID=615 RepID=UPI0034E29445
NLRFGSKSVAAPRFLPPAKRAFLHAPPQGALPPRRHNFSPRPFTGGSSAAHDIDSDDSSNTVFR